MFTKPHEPGGTKDSPVEVTLNSVNGKSAKVMVYDPKERIQSVWAKGNFYEANRNGLCAYLWVNDYSGRALDIGANIGNHTLFFEKILGCNVTSIEPDPECYERLNENCELNEAKATLYNLALGEDRKRVGIKNVSKNGGNIGMNNIIEGDNIQMVSLDQLELGQFDFIKIDVEHYNVPLLKGAKATLIDQADCHVFIECETTEILKQTDEIMIDYGYILQPIKLNHTPTYLWIKSE